MHRGPFRFSFATSIHVVIVLALLAGACGVLVAQPAQAGAPNYPDLFTARTRRMWIEAPNGAHRNFVLRFDNIVGNSGGKLDLEAIHHPDLTKTIYQNVFDGPNGGAIVERRAVNSDFIYHPQHNHFHFSGFATYYLVKRDSRGAYRPTTSVGNKTSFCILDSIHISQIANVFSAAEITRSEATCNANHQGLSANYADVYTAELPDQWIDLGSATLTNGQYAIVSVADPQNKIKERIEQNNAAQTFFTYTNGNITITSAPPHCLVTPGEAKVDQVLTINCSGFSGGEQVDLFWGSTNTTPKQTVTANSSGAVTGSFKVPESGSGYHYVIAEGRTSNKIAFGIMKTIPRLSIVPTIGKVGSTVNVTAHGFAAGESVAFSFYKLPNVATHMVTAPSDKYGRAATSFVVPTSQLGSHLIVARGVSSGQKASRTYTVQPNLTLVPTSGAEGATIGVSLRGFKAGEKVEILFEGRSTPRATITVSSTGSAVASSTNSFTIPAVSAPGNYTVTAKGLTSGVSSSRTLMVTGPGGSNTTPTATATATETATAEASPTESIVTETPTTEPTPTATESPTETPTEVPTETPVPTDTSTPTATLTETPTP